MAPPHNWQPALRNEATFATQVETWLNEVLPLSKHPLLLSAPPPAEQAIWESGEAIARRMILNVSRTNAVAWRTVAARGTSMRTSARIFAALKDELSGKTGARVRELIERQTQLITALPAAVDRQTALFIAKQQQRGMRSTAIMPELQRRLPQLRKSAVRMLARGGVARAETALTRARSEDLGIAWYDWATSEDQRVRPSHRFMDKILCAWNDPPSPEALIGVKSQGHYHPGGTRWCRCLSLPVVDLAELRWPHKVLRAGAVSRMSRLDFERVLRAA
jgi:SPP1 gp7 family putative phage head morphogenesis protein